MKKNSNLVIFAGFGFRQAFQPFIQPVQSFNHDFVQPFMQGVMHMIMGEHDHGHKFRDDGTESPQVTPMMVLTCNNALTDPGHWSR